MPRLDPSHRMKFRSNTQLAITTPDLKQAEAFYSSVLGFRLTRKTAALLEYDTGRFQLQVKEGSKTQWPVPSLSVINASAAKAHLIENGCEIVEDRGRALNFKDPFGIIYDVVED